MIVAVPGAEQLTIPPPETTATVGLELLHAPKGVASVSVVVLPQQKEVTPPIAAGIELTVSVALVEHPLPIE